MRELLPTQIAELRKNGKASLLAKLEKHGLRDNIFVGVIRATRKNRVGYYNSLSQFRSIPRLMVDIKAIAESCGSLPYIEEQVDMTLAHEYGHVMAECIRCLPRYNQGQGFVGLPDWNVVFDQDEEAFAEDFARFLVTYDALEEPFWDAFMTAYVGEFNRIFVQSEGRNAA